MSTTIMPQVSSQAVDGVRIRYADSGAPQEPTLLLTSPWPESVWEEEPTRYAAAVLDSVTAIDHYAE